MNKYFLAVFCFAALLITSCSTQYYAPGLYMNDTQDMLRRNSKDSAKSANYLQVVNFLSTSVGSSNDNSGGKLSFYRTTLFEKYSVGYGVFGYLGQFSTQSNISSNTTTKSFGGFGASVSGSYYTVSDKADFHLIGLTLTYSNESGEYADFRQQVAQDKNNYTLNFPQTNLFTISPYSEINLQTERGLRLGFKLALDATPGAISSALFSTPFTSFSYRQAIGFKNFDGTIRLGQTFASQSSATSFIFNIGAGVRF
jgi:hypothetical protein